MRYKQIFKRWWFWLLVILEFVLNIYAQLKVYGYLFLVEYFGIAIGSFINITLLASLVWLICKGIGKLRKKKKS